MMTMSHNDAEIEVQNHESEVAPGLEEEFSQLSSTEASCYCQVSDVENYWHRRTNSIPDTEANGQEDGDDLVSSSSSRSENDLDVNEWPKLEEDLHSKEEARKKFNKVTSMPHAPRINNELLSSDETFSDRQLLFERLELYNLVEKKVDGDGNCQFRALSDQLFQTPEYHMFLRNEVVEQLLSRPEMYEGYVPTSYDEYLMKMSRNGEWGDHVTLKAAADLYGVKILIFTSFKDSCNIEILPAELKSNRVVLLSFWAEVHYNSVYPDGGEEVTELKKTKKKKNKKNKKTSKWQLLDDWN